MSCNIESLNWLDQAKQKLLCGLGIYTVEQLKTINIGLKIEKLVCNFRDALDEDNASSCVISTSVTLSQIYNRIKCGETLSELEREWAEANILIKEIEGCETLYNA